MWVRRAYGSCMSVCNLDELADGVLGGYVLSGVDQGMREFLDDLKWYLSMFHRCSVIFRSGEGRGHWIVSMPWSSRNEPKHRGRISPGTVLHQEETRNHCTSMSDNHSEDFNPLTNSSQACSGLWREQGANIRPANSGGQCWAVDAGLKTGHWDLMPPSSLFLTDLIY